MRPTLTLQRLAVGAVALAVTAVGLGACGDDDGSATAGGGRPSIVATTSILGDVVTEVVGDDADVTVVMPRGADPHEFAPSARQVEAMAEADLLVVNGGGFEEGLEEAIDGAVDAGVTTFAFTDHVELLGNDDPHFWTDPGRMAGAIGPLTDAVVGLDAVDDAAVEARAEAYAGELRRLDEEVVAMVATVPPAGRVLVTNHDVLAYLADRYGFEVVGTVIPSSTTGADASAGQLDRLAELIADREVPAIFADVTSSSRLADALAGSVGRPVEVVALHSESLGEPGSGAETYVGMVRSNAQLITEALR